jgi:putative FmdB family regulatory protein
MPLYEYKCELCGAVVEHLVRTTDRVEEMPCSKNDCVGQTKRMVSHTSFVLKGGGWASDGYSR